MRDHDQDTGLVKQSKKQLEALRSDRSPFLADWRNVSRWVLGVESRYLHDSNQGVSDGNTDLRSSRNESLYNETAKFSAQVLASGMMAGITSPARPWFNLAAPDQGMMEYGPVKAWLDDVEKILYSIFAKSNFYKVMHGQYMNLGTFGLSAFGAYEDYNTIARFDPYPVGSYMLALNGKNEADTIYREYSLTVKQAADRFGIKNMSQQVQNLFKNNQMNQPVYLVHVMEPNPNAKHGSPLSQDMAFRSYYYEKSTGRNNLIMQSGFNEQAFMSPRWNVMGNDVYSTIYPGIDSLGTNKALQVNELDLAIAIEKQHNPPLVGDSSIARDGSDLIAGGITYVPNIATSGKPGLSPVYNVNPDINGLVMTMKEKENRINRHFYADLFMMISDMDRAQITATEIAERKEEKLLILGPVLESVNTEMLDPAIDRTFAIAQRAGILPPPPPELDGVDLQVEYVSVLAQAQKAISTSSVEATAAFAMQLAQVDPMAMDKFDTDQAIDEYSKAKGAPPKVIRSDDDAAAIRENRAMAQAQQAQKIQEQEAANTAKTLSEASTEEGSVLSGLLEGQ